MLRIGNYQQSLWSNSTPSPSFPEAPPSSISVSTFAEIHSSVAFCLPHSESFQRAGYVKTRVISLEMGEGKGASKQKDET